jgi:RsiW-degrading membrane proteinase PrsW (M82 family)
MSYALVVPTVLCLLPVLSFLLALVYLDSYKLVRPAAVLGLLAAGVAIAGVSYLLNDALLRVLAVDRTVYSRYISPPLEELLKGAIVVWLVRRHRIGFLVDAAIAGFAVGCGFALVENLYVLWHVPGAGIPTWIVRGFGTAIMHGGATAILAIVALAVLEHDERHGMAALLPGYAVAVALHSAFNHLVHEPKLATIAVLVMVPALLLLAFRRGESVLGEWMSGGFDADTRMLEILHSGRLPDTHVGRYLGSLRQHFRGPVVGDLLAYVGLYTELALRAKSALLMREHGFEPAPDAGDREKFAELRFLESSIGPTGLVALHPLLPMRRRALSQIYAQSG